MVQRVITQLVDDLSGEDIAEGKGETVSFGVDGQEYSIDLTRKNADAFRGLLQEYIAAGRKVGRRTGRAGKRSQISNTREVRDWARSNGFPDLSERGRIPAEVQEAFDSR